MINRPALAAARATFAEDGTRFDAVVIAAAIHGGCPAVAMSDAFVVRLLDVNLGAHTGFVRDILPCLKDGVRLIAICSNCAEVGTPMESAYAATKAGQKRYYEALVLELADRRPHPADGGADRQREHRLQRDRQCIHARRRQLRRHCLIVR